jgi:hypothetical protein
MWILSQFTGKNGNFGTGKEKKEHNNGYKI